MVNSNNLDYNSDITDNDEFNKEAFDKRHISKSDAGARCHH